MPEFPKQYYRLTKHKTPRKEFYWPGFNRHNSCWLHGSWQRVTDEQWIGREAHQRLYKGIKAEMRSQHHRNGQTALAAMSPAQRQAWEHYSGNTSFECLQGDRVQGVGIEMAGNTIPDQQLKWLRSEGYLILRSVTDAQGQVVDQLADLTDVPADVVSEAREADGTPIAVWDRIVEQNREREREMFDGMLEMVGQPMAAGVAVQCLLGTEEEIIRDEWNRQTGRPDLFPRAPEVMRAEYVDRRERLRAALDPDFEAFYLQSKASHNECGRANLDNSEGSLFSFVLPVFHADGSHEPWGPRDVPWGAEDDEDDE